MTLCVLVLLLLKRLSWGSFCYFLYLFHVLLAVKITGSYIAVLSNSLLPSLAILP